MTWSSQQYIKDGLAAGIDLHILQSAVTQIEEVVVHKPELPALLTLNHLAVRSKSNYLALRAAISRKQGFYRHFRIRKRSGGHRVISIPHPTLMNAQRWINAHILSHQPVHHSSYAFSPKSSILKCASRHVGARWLVKLDVAGFFGSISEIQVYRVFRALGYQPLISFELARLTTHAPRKSERYRFAQWRAKTHSSPITEYSFGGMGYLPQGAPTSPMLSNLVMLDIDKQIEALAKAAGVRYTRYSDDITFSTTGNFNRQRAKRLIWEVAALLRRIGLHLNTQKTTIVPPGGRKIVLGLLVDDVTPRLSRSFRSNLRQHLYYLEKLGPIEHAAQRGFDTIWGMYRHIRGLIDFAKMVEPLYADKVLARFNAVDWPDASFK